MKKIIKHYPMIDRLIVRRGYIYVCSRGGCYDRDRMVVGFTNTMPSVPITTNIVSSNPAQGAMYSIQHYVIRWH